MNYYDYRSYFQTLINNTDKLLQQNSTLILFLQVFLFMFTIYFLYRFISSMVRGRY